MSFFPSVPLAPGGRYVCLAAAEKPSLHCGINLKQSSRDWVEVRRMWQGEWEDREDPDVFEKDLIIHCAYSFLL